MERLTFIDHFLRFGIFVDYFQNLIPGKKKKKVVSLKQLVKVDFLLNR